MPSTYKGIRHKLHVTIRNVHEEISVHTVGVAYGINKGIAILHVRLPVEKMSLFLSRENKKVAESSLKASLCCTRTS